MRFRRDLFAIHDHAQTTDAKAERPRVAVRERQGLQIEAGDPQSIARLERVQIDLGGAGPRARLDRVVKDVAKAGAELGRMLFRHVHRERASTAHAEDPQIVNAVNVVRVHMSQKDRVHPLHIGAQQQQPEFGRCIDEQHATLRLERQAMARAPVPWVVRRAHGAVAANHRHAEAGTRA